MTHYKKRGLIEFTGVDYYPQYYNDGLYFAQNDPRMCNERDSSGYWCNRPKNHKGWHETTVSAFPKEAYARWKNITPNDLKIAKKRMFMSDKEAKFFYKKDKKVNA